MQRFELIKKIGSGAYSEVFKAWDYSSNSYVAIKQTNHTNPDTKVVLNRQIRILKKFNHPNIIKLLGCYSDNCYTYLILEYLPYDLITYYKELWKQSRRKLTDREITHIFHKISEAINYMHSNFNIMHRDIKPQNILFDPNSFSVKVIDFGFAAQMSFYKKNTDYMVTRWYRPLQIVLGLPYDLKSDIFALGALLLQLYMGQQVFKSASNIDQIYWIYEICGFPHWQPAIMKMRQLGIVLNPEHYPKIFDMTKNLRFEASNLIVGMLQSVPLNRLNIYQVVNHQYFAQFSANKKRIISQQSYSNNLVNSMNHHNLNLNFDNLIQSTPKYPTIHSDRQYNNNSTLIQNNDKYVQPTRRNSQYSSQAKNISFHRSQPSYHKYAQNRYQQITNKHYDETKKNEQVYLKKQINKDEIVHKINGAKNGEDYEKKREGRTNSVRIEVTSMNRNSYLSQQEYYTPTHKCGYKNYEKNRLQTTESEKRFVPLKLKPPMNIARKDPTFAKIRNKIFESQARPTHKTKISLSNRFFPHNSTYYTDQKGAGRNHIGLQINR